MNEPTEPNPFSKPDPKLYAQTFRASWLTWSELVQELAPFLNADGLRHVIRELRPPRVTEAGEHGLWSGLPEHLASQREQLRYALIERYEALTGREWPYPDDVPPVIPDDASGLEGDA